MDDITCHFTGSYSNVIVSLTLFEGREVPFHINSLSIKAASFPSPLGNHSYIETNSPTTQPSTTAVTEDAHISTSTNRPIPTSTDIQPGEGKLGPSGTTTSPITSQGFTISGPCISSPTTDTEKSLSQERQGSIESQGTLTVVTARGRITACISTFI